MKRRFAIFNLALMAVVQFAIAFQSFHAFTHHHDHEHEHKHHHTTALKHKADVAAADDEHSCSVCDFHFDFFTAPNQFYLKLDFAFFEIPYQFKTTEEPVTFCGSLFALRAPPALS